MLLVVAEVQLVEAEYSGTEEFEVLKNKTFKYFYQEFENENRFKIGETFFLINNYVFSDRYCIPIVGLI